MANQSKDLLLDDGTCLQYLSKDYSHYLNKTTLLYGMTDSGKSTIISEIMYLCKSYISSIFVICKSTVTTSSSDYYNIIPTYCIKSSVTKEWLEKLMEIQKGRTALFKTANDINTLKKVYNRIRSSTAESLENSINAEAIRHINNVNSNPKMDFAQKRETIKTIDNIRYEKLTALYKKNIRKNKNSMESQGFIADLSADEICCINYLDFNPNMMIIYDDCAASFRRWVKDSEIIKEMFYACRHYYITQIISTQDDKEIDSELRKNAKVSIFTTAQASSANFTRGANFYPKTTKVRAEICCKRVFNNTGTSRNYKKLIYKQGDNSDPFYYTIAELYTPFRMGGNALWELDEKLNNLNDTSAMSNAFFNAHFNK